MRYDLPGNFGGLQKRAGEGCEGCRFFYDTLRDHLFRRWWYGSTPRTEPIAPETKVHIESHTGAVTQYELGIGNNSQRCTMDLRKATDLKFQHDLSPQIPINPNDEACWGTALGWLETCITKHASCIASAMAPILPKRIIDVLPDNEQTHARIILPATNTAARFVALSHCWGSQEDKPMTKLTSENQTTWQRHGIDVQSLPLNFRDAITATRRLGIRYLWIDALCILQDSTADWVAEAPKMANIFGTATLVLSATSAKHCDDGILQPRLSTCSPLLGPSKNWFLTRPKLTFTTTMESEINAGHLSSRGWAAQERMVAQRVLHYTPAGMIWECNTHLRSELPWVKAEENKRLIPNLLAAHRRSRRDDQSDPMPIPKGTTSSRFWPYRLPHRPAKKKEIAGRRTRDGGGTNSQGETWTDAGVFLKEWSNCITLYSSRDLTFPSDKLAAVAGIAAIFQASLPPAGEYLAGAWSGCMAMCLGWAKRVHYPHKLPSLSDHAFRAPSWSWAAGDGRISWPREEEDQSSSPRATRSLTFYPELDARLVEHHIVPVDGDGPNHFIGAQEGSYITLEANCIHPSDLSGITAVQSSYVPDWAEYATGNPLPEHPGFDDGEFKVVQLRSRFVVNKKHHGSGPSSYCEFWGLHLHRRSGPGSEFRRTGLLTCKIPYEVGRFNRAKAMAAVEEQYKSLSWKRERVKII